MEEPNSLLTHFTAAITARNPLLKASPAYVWLYWRPYLGAMPFDLWHTLIAFQQSLRQEEAQRWPPITHVLDVLAIGDRHTLFGRAETAAKAKQESALQRLVEEHLAVYLIHGQDNGQRYTFEVRESVPALTPTQAARLSGRLQKSHRKHLVAAGVNMQVWEQIAPATMVRPPGAFG